MSPYTSLFLSAIAALGMLSSQVQAQDSNSAAFKQILESLDPVPECARQCSIDLLSISLPCAWTPPSDSKASPQDIELNIVSCQCTDKGYMSTALGCLLNDCKSNATAISAEFDRRYSDCAEAGVKLAPPAELLKELSVKVPSDVTVPSSASGQAKVTVFPSQTATVPYPSSAFASESVIQSAFAAELVSFIQNPSAAASGLVTASILPSPSGAVGTGAAGATGTGGAGAGSNGTAPAASTAKPNGGASSTTSSSTKPSQTGSAVRNTAFSGIIGLVGMIALMAVL